MRRRLLLGLGVGALLLGSSLTIDAAYASSAASIDDSGWWWRLQTNPQLLLPAPPGVEPGQLLVQGAPDGASAVAAVAATLKEGEANPVLTLEVAEDTGGEDAVLLACQAGSSWTGGDAKVWTEKPSPACNAGGVAGSRSEDGKSWSFDLASMQFTDKVNVVLVPGKIDGQPEGANGSVFSLTFEEPSEAAVESSPGAPPLTTLPPLNTVPEVTTPAESPSFESPPVDSGSFDLPPVEAALPEEEQGLTPVAPSVQAQTPLLPASVAIDPRSEHAEAVGIALLLLGAALTYWMTKQQPAIGPEGIPGGLGRWAGPRWGSPPALRG